MIKISTCSAYQISTCRAYHGVWSNIQNTEITNPTHPASKSLIRTVGWVDISCPGLFSLLTATDKFVHFCNVVFFLLTVSDMFVHFRNVVFFLLTETDIFVHFLLYYLPVLVLPLFLRPRSPCVFYCLSSVKLSVEYAASLRICPWESGTIYTKTGIKITIICWARLNVITMDWIQLLFKTKTDRYQFIYFFKLADANRLISVIYSISPSKKWTEDLGNLANIGI